MEVAFDNTGNYCACLLARAMLPSTVTQRKSNRQVKPNMRYASYGMQMLQASRRKRVAELNVEPHSGTAAAEQSGGVDTEVPPEVAVLEPDGGTTAAEQSGGVEIEVPPEVAVLEPDGGTTAAEQSGGVEIEDPPEVCSTTEVPPEVGVLEPDGGTTAAEQSGAVAIEDRPEVCSTIEVPPQVAVLETDGGTTVGEESGASCDNTVVGMARKARDRVRRAVGYTPAKRRRRALRHRMLSFSPPRVKTVFKRVIVPFDSSDDGSDADLDKTSDIQTPAANSIAEAQHQPQQSRKRLRNESGWKRNIKKQARVDGRAYVNSQGRLIGEKTAKVDQILCGKSECRLKCSSRVDNNARLKIFSEYYSLSSEAQNAHLFASLQCSAPKTVVVSSERHRGVSVRYGVVVGGSRISVCKKAFMSLHVITQSKVDHLVQQARAQQATARPCLRGKHANRPNRLSQEKVDMVKEHIQSYPAESSHYSRHKNPNRLYLSPFLSISEMYRQYEVWSAARHVVPVSHAAYRNIFCTHFNYGFGTPRSDTCNKCERTQTDASACDIDAHKALAEAAFQQQREDRRRAITETDVFYITFDMEKTLPLPKLAVSAAFYLRQLWLYNTGVHLISKQKEGPFYNVWTEDQGGRGVQEVASSLLAFLQASGVAGGTLIAWSDSCCGQNKNFLFLCFWQYLLAKKKFDCIEHKFPEPGHSYLDSDRDFGHIELAVKRRQNVYSIDEYCDIIMHSSSKPRPVITRMGDKMCDIACLPTMLSLRKATHNMNGEKIELRDRVKWIKMTKLGYYEYKHSFDDNEEWKVVCMLSSDTGPVDVPDLPLQLVSRHTIKKLKVEDIKKQMQYIPIIYQGYYKSVIDRSVQDDAVSCPECSDVDEIDADGSLSHSQVR